jgi:uncharacterized membrane protein
MTWPLWPVWLLVAITLCGLAVLGLLSSILPGITRRGLLFGTYVGSGPDIGTEAQRIRATWSRGVLRITVLSVAMGILVLVWAVVTRGATAPAAPLLWLGLAACYALLVAGISHCSVHARRAARSLAAVEPPPPAVAPLGRGGRRSVLPVFTLLIAVTVGLLCITYTWMHYDLLRERWFVPERFPRHYAPTGAPDAFMRRSFTIMIMLPLSTLLVGVWTATLAWLFSRAKRAVRLEDGDVSLRAQERFRAMTTRFWCGISLLATACYGTLSIWLVQFALGPTKQGQLAHPVVTATVLFCGICVGVYLLYFVVGLIYIGVRVGQGGGKLETSVATAPLTDGLADNTKWKHGFYFNRDDASLFVEDRFGYGYAPNWGSPKAVAFFVGFLLVCVAMMVLSFVGVLG